jgi:hypothetical protein
VNASGDAGPQVRARSGRLRSLATIAILDVGAPLATYQVLTSEHRSAVTALLVSGVFPAIAVLAGVVRNRRLDVIGGLVLLGIAVGTITGLAFHSARLLLIEGSVPTGVLGVAFLGSLRARRPLMFSMALEFIGPQTEKGLEMTTFWAHPAFRRSMRIMTAVWGLGFLVEAAARIVIIYSTSTGTALAISKVMPFVVVGVLLAWTMAYGNLQRRKTEPTGADEPADVAANSAGARGPG